MYTTPFSVDAATVAWTLAESYTVSDQPSSKVIAFDVRIMLSTVGYITRDLVVHINCFRGTLPRNDINVFASYNIFYIP